MTSSKQRSADSVLSALEALVGVWTMAVTGPDQEPWPGEGRTRFYWHETGVYLVQETTIDVPEMPDSTAIMGCDGANATLIQLYSDERGVNRIYAMSFSEGRWTLSRDGDPFPQRFMATISEDGQTIEGRWDKAVDGGDFSVDFYLTYRRVTDS
jgi:hypothetical protein